MGRLAVSIFPFVATSLAWGKTPYRNVDASQAQPKGSQQVIALRLKARDYFPQRPFLFTPKPDQRYWHDEEGERIIQPWFQNGELTHTITYRYNDQDLGVNEASLGAKRDFQYRSVTPYRYADE